MHQVRCNHLPGLQRLGRTYMDITSKTQTEFDRALAQLDAEIARFEASVDECCSAIETFKANL